MIELGQLERRHEDFERRQARVVVVSVEGLDDAKQTQKDFPHLVVLSDEGHQLSDALGTMHSHAGRDGGDIDAPTTILVDGRGTVRWLYRSPRIIARLSPDEVLEAIDLHGPAGKR
jgi:peroxiredoxin